MQTVVHVTHEAIQKIGGIGAVLQGLLTSQVYLDQGHAQHPRRPVLARRRARRAAPRAAGRGALLQPRLSSTARRWPRGSARSSRRTTSASSTAAGGSSTRRPASISTPEVLLIDVSRYDAKKIGEFKFELWKKFGIDSQQVRAHLGLRAVHAPRPARDRRAARAGRGQQRRAVRDPLHEYMGMPTVPGRDPGGRPGATSARSSTPTRSRTMRRIVEGHPGHDTMFYNVMRTAMAAGALRRGRVRRPDAATTSTRW